MLLPCHSQAPDICVSFSDVTQVGKLYRFATLTKDFKVYKSEVIVLYDKNFLWRNWKILSAYQNSKYKHFNLKRNPYRIIQTILKPLCSTGF